jgi:hypothetical protein
VQIRIQAVLLSRTDSGRFDDPDSGRFDDLDTARFDDPDLGCFDDPDSGCFVYLDSVLRFFSDMYGTAKKLPRPGIEPGTFRSSV